LKKPTENLPALDNVELRQLNTKKVVNAFDSIGKHFEEIRKWNKVVISISVVTGLIMLVFLGIVVYSAFTIKGSSIIDNFVDRDMLATRIQCCDNVGTNGGGCITFRTPTAAKDFKEIFPFVDCVYWDMRTK